jgi:hypothetical protein
MSKPKPIFFGEVKQGKVSLWDKTSYMVWLSKLEGKEVQVTVGAREKKRTMNQNSYLFGVVYAIIQESTGYETVDEVHEAMKFEYLRVNRGNGLPPTTKSTTDLTTKKFGEYIDAIKRDAARGKFGGPESGIFIPDPGEVWT